jgi:hypothetical protein
MYLPRFAASGDPGMTLGVWLKDEYQAQLMIRISNKVHLIDGYDLGLRFDADEFNTYTLRYG